MNLGSPDLEGVLLQTDLFVTDVVLVEGLVEFGDSETLLNGDDIHVLQAVLGVARAVQELSDEHQKHHMFGRPEIRISEEHLALLLDTIRAIANMFRVSPRTIRRRIVKYGLDEDTSFIVQQHTLEVRTPKFTVPLNCYNGIFSKQ